MTKTTELKQENIQRIRECFYRKEYQTKGELSEETGISLSLTTNILQYLIAQSEILYICDADSTGGRRSKMYTLNPEYHHMLCMSLQRTSEKHIIETKIQNLRHKILYHHRTIDTCGTWQMMKQEIHDALKYDPSIHLLVLSIPGVSRNGVVEVCDWHEIESMDICQNIRKCFRIDCIIENDVNTAAIGLYHLHPDMEHLALIYQPSVEYAGVGMIIHGRLYNGFSHMAGEVRYLPCHMTGSQDQRLKTEPDHLLMDQITAVAAIMNPQLIGWESDVIQEPEINDAFQNIPAEHRPVLEHVTDMNNLMFTGLYEIGKKTLMRRKHD
ncbi:MAG: ROK family protein [Bulleidia sp.]